MTARDWKLEAVRLQRLMDDLTGEPSEAMLVAACEVGPDTNAGPFSYEDARVVFLAMIRARVSQ